MKTGKLPLGILRSNKELKGSIDFFGFNYYNRSKISRDLHNIVEAGPDVDPELLCEGLGWEPYPEGLYFGLQEVIKYFPDKPIYITENGIANQNDLWRQKYIIDHLKMVHKAG